MSAQAKARSIIDRYARYIKEAQPHRHATLIADCEEELRPMLGQRLAAIEAARIKPTKREVR